MAALTNQILFQGLFKAVDLFYHHPDIKDTVVTVKGYGSLYINKKETLRTFKEVMTQLRHMEDDKLVEYLYTNKASRADPFINTLNIPEGTTEEKIPKVFSDKALEEVEKTVKANSANVSGEDKTKRDQELKQWSDKQFGKEATPQITQEEKPEQVQTQTEAQTVENKPSEGEIKFNEQAQEEKIAEARPTESTLPIEKAETPITPPIPISIPEVAPPSIQPATENLGWVERSTTHPHTPPVEKPPEKQEIPPIHPKGQAPLQEISPNGAKPPKSEISRRSQVPSVPSAFQEKEKPREPVPRPSASPTAETIPSILSTQPTSLPLSLKDKAIVALKRAAPSIKRFAKDQISSVARTAKSLISKVSFPALAGGILGGGTLGYFGSSLGPVGVVSGMATGAALGGFVTDSIVKGQGAFSREPVGYFEIAGGEEGDIPYIPPDEYPTGQIIYTDQGGAQNYQGGGGRSFNPQQIPRGFPRLNRHNNLVRQLSSRPGMKIVKQLGAQALRSGIVAAFESNPVGWIITGIVALLILGIALIYLLNNTNKSTAQCPAYMYGSKDCWKQQISDQTPQIPGSGNQNNPSSSNNLKIVKIGPEAVGDDYVDGHKSFDYKIDVTNVGGSQADGIITDNIPDEVSHDLNDVKASDGGTFDGKQVKWQLTGIQASATKSLTLSVVPVKKDVYAVNNAQGTSTSTPASTNSLAIKKDTDKTAVNAGDTVTFTLNVNASYLIGDKITITDQIPDNTSFVSSDPSITPNGRTLQWDLSATKNQTSQTNRIIPPRVGVTPPGVGRPVQRITATVDQIRAELQKYSPAMVDMAEVVYNVGVEFNVDPAFIMGIWNSESGYSKMETTPNNPGNISCVRVGLYGNNGCAGRWSTFATRADGLRAIAMLIAKEYYPHGQTDTWTINSGLDPDGDHAYHCRCDIGVGSIQTWDDYVNDYYNRLAVMDRISGGSGYSLNQSVKFTVKADKDSLWVSNKATAFAPGTGNVDSNSVSVKVGNAPDSQKPGGTISPDSGPPTHCSGTTVSFGDETRLLPLPESPIFGDTSGKTCSQTQYRACGRTNICIKPQRIVMHTTHGAPSQSTDEVWKFFASGSNGVGVGAHFLVGKDGHVIKIAELLGNSAEETYGVANYNDASISIEMVYEGDYGLNDTPAPQYQATLNLVKALMKQYNIPIGNLEFDWRSSSDQPNSQVGGGVFGHYQLNPQTKTDPGQGLMQRLRQDLKSGS